MNTLRQLTPEQAETHRRVTRLRPLDAFRAMRVALRDPDDTVQAVRMVGAMAGKSPDRIMRRFLDTPAGEEILTRKESLLDTLVDRDRLMAMPEGSFGRTYAEWVRREQLSAEGLAEASAAGARGAGETSGPYAVLGSRLRDMHDLLHVITGYGRDIVGETGVLAFTYGQTKHTGIGFLVVLAFLGSLVSRSDPSGAGTPKARAAVREQLREGYRRGRDAGWIVGADWEALLELPIDEVRRRFAISDPTEYLVIRTPGAPPLSA